MPRINTRSTIDTSDAGAPATATAASPGDAYRLRVLKVTGTYSDAASQEGQLQIIADLGGDDEEVLWDLHVPQGGGAGEEFVAGGGLQCPAGVSVSAVLAGATAAVGKVNLLTCLEQ